MRRCSVLFSRVRHTESQVIVARLNIRFNDKELTRTYSLVEELRFAMLENTDLVKMYFTPNSACDFDDVGLTRVCIASGLDKSGQWIGKRRRPQIRR